MFHHLYRSNRTAPFQGSSRLSCLLTTGLSLGLLGSLVPAQASVTSVQAMATELIAQSNNSNAVSLSWSAWTGADATYTVYASTKSDFTPSPETRVIQNLRGTSYTHVGLNSSTAYYYKVVASNDGATVLSAKVITQAAGNSVGFKLAAGPDSFEDFVGGRFVIGGQINTHAGQAINTQAVTNPAPQSIYQTERWGAAAWTLGTLNAGGSYQVVLHFVEPVHTAAGQRLFDVSINGETVLSGFDIYATAGGQNRAITRSFVTRANEFGLIEIQTLLGTSQADSVDLNPTIAALEIIPTDAVGDVVGATPGKSYREAVNVGGQAVSGFGADATFNGGIAVSNANAIDLTGVNHAAPVDVYHSQRYAPSTSVLTGFFAGDAYRVRLHFAETYWTGAGQRLFNVAINGSPVLSEFDVFAEAGGRDRALVKEFTVNADRYGQIILQFTKGSADLPMICGIEASRAPELTAPGALVASYEEGSHVRLSWTASQTPNVWATKYAIYRSTTRNFQPSAANLLQSGVYGSGYIDSAVSPDTTYYYCVMAELGDYASPASNPACATTTMTPTTVLRGAMNGNAPALTWDMVGGYLSTTYAVHRSTNPDFKADASNILYDGICGAGYTDQSAASNTTYYYAVTVRDGAKGESVPSNKVSLTTSGSAVAAPSNLVGSYAFPYVHLGWSASMSAGPRETSYNVYRSTTPNFQPSLSTLIKSGIYGLSYMDSQAGGNITYYYIVTAQVGQNLSAASNMAAVVAKSSLVAPNNLKVAYTSPYAQLSWAPSPSALADPRAISYNVYRSVSPYFTPSPSLLVKGGIYGLNYTDNAGSGIISYTLDTWYYVVTAKNAQGEESPVSNIVSVCIANTANTANTALTSAPTSLAQTAAVSTSAVSTVTAPIGLTGSYISPYVHLGWTGVGSPRNTSYSVYRSTTPDFQPSAANLVQSSIYGQSFLDGAVVSGITYYYIVTTKTAAGESAPSNQVAVKVVAPVAAPTGLTATYISPYIHLGWAGVGSPRDTSYSVYRSTTPNFLPSAATLVQTSIYGQSFLDVAVTSGTTYYYVVTAKTSAGESAVSNQAAAKVQ